MTFAYPETRTDNTEDTLSGVSFPDPYRWLEGDGNDVLGWQQAQAKLASNYAREWPHFDRLNKLAAHYCAEEHFATLYLPRFAGGRWFHLRSVDDASPVCAFVFDGEMESGRVLFDPTSESAERPPFLSWAVPSPDGKVLAIGVCPDGSENNTVRLVDVETGVLLPNPPTQTLMDNWTGGVQWLPDSSGFFFSAITGAATDFSQAVYLHRRGIVPTTEVVDIEWLDGGDYRVVVVSDDGRYATAMQRLMNPIPLAIAELNGGPLTWRPFITAIDSPLPGHIVGDRYVAVTNAGAARGRIVAIPLNAIDPSNTDNWIELVPESDAVVRSATPVGNLLYLTEFVDTYSRVRIFDMHGTEQGKVPLPNRAAVDEPPAMLMNLVASRCRDRMLFSCSSLTESSGTYAHVPGKSALETVLAPRVKLENALVEDRWAVSVDGTRIPYHIVRRADQQATGPRPTLIYAYGGFNIPLLPQFPGSMAALVEMGAIFVHAHLRGGGELGLDWWQGGRMQQKQNGYDDLYAIAEDLIRAGRCTPESLAVTGLSNGGLMAGVALTQRPDLWGAVVPRVPILDLVGACRDGYGREGVGWEYANVDDPDDVKRMTTFSPYHLVRDGASYPAVFIEAGDKDPRCPPWHARKFAASLQRATRGSSPVLLRVWENSGHGMANDKDTTVAQSAEWMAFVLRHTGYDLSFGV